MFKKYMLPRVCILGILCVILVSMICSVLFSNKYREVSISDSIIKMKITDEHANLDNVKSANKIYFNIDGKDVDADMTDNTLFKDVEDVTDGVVYIIETDNLDLIHAKIVEVWY